MALLGAHKGSWFGLPDFGITEAVARVTKAPQTAQGGSNIVRSTNYAQTPSTSQPMQSYAPMQSTAPLNQSNQGQVLGRATGGGNAAAPISGTPPGQGIIQNDIQNQVNSGNNIIDRDFETALAQFSNQEEGLRRDADSATSQVRNQGQQVSTALQSQRDQNITGLGEQESTANKQAGSALQQARDLYRQLTQQNVAQLSASGLSSSSVAEALSERLGVETARRIAGVTGSRDEIVQNITKERTRINDVFGQKKTELEQGIANQVTQIQNGLLSGLDTINNARNSASADKANARERLLTNAQSQIAQLQAQAQQFQQELQQAASRRQESLNESLNLLTAKPADFNNLTNNINSIAPALQGTGLDFGINVNQKGQPTFSFTTPKKSEEEELFL